MKLTEIGKTLKLNRTTLHNLVRFGKLKTAKKIKENHQEIWTIDDNEAKEYINSNKK